MLMASIYAFPSAAQQQARVCYAGELARRSLSRPARCVCAYAAPLPGGSVRRVRRGAALVRLAILAQGGQYVACDGITRWR